MTTENNKIIAEFMGYVVGEQYTHIKGNSRSNDELKFHSDWNWLMEVVEKIENLTDKNNFVLYDISIYPDGVIVLDQEEHEKVSITKGDGFTSKIEMVYNACVEFIKWYNEQNK